MTDDPKKPTPRDLFIAASKARKAGVAQDQIDVALQARIGQTYDQLAVTLKSEDATNVKGAAANLLTGGTFGLANLVPGVRDARADFAKDHKNVGRAVDVMGSLAMPLPALSLLKGAKATTAIGRAVQRAPGLMAMGAVEGGSRAEPGSRPKGTAIGMGAGLLASALPAAASFAWDLAPAKLTKTIASHTPEAVQRVVRSIFGGRDAGSVEDFTLTKPQPRVPAPVVPNVPPKDILSGFDLVPPMPRTPVRGAPSEMEIPTFMRRGTPPPTTGPGLLGNLEIRPKGGLLGQDTYASTADLQDLVKRLGNDPEYQQAIRDELARRAKGIMPPTTP